MAKQGDVVSNYLQLRKQFQEKLFAPVILLQGDEVYFVDSLMNQLEASVLTEAEKSFNQTVVYGKDVKVNDLVSMARRYPMMSNHQLIVVKDAQDMKEFDKLESYLENPLNTTVLVLGFRGAKLDARTKVAKLCAKHVVFTADKLRDYQIKDWLPTFMKLKGRSIDTQAVQLLLDFLGSDLSVIQNELEKVLISVKEEFIKTGHIEAHVGFNREYNVFELQNALGERNFNKSIQIAHQIGLKADKGEILRMVPVLHSYFTKILHIKSQSFPNEQAIASFLGVNPFFVKGYLLAARNYTPADLERIFNLLKLFDLKLKGVHRGSASDGDILVETTVGILRTA